MAEESDCMGIGCMLASLGGSVEPLLVAIGTYLPRNIIFFCSAQSRTQVNREILPRLREKHDGYSPDTEIVVSENPDDVGTCALCLLSEIPKAMAKLSLPGNWPELVDYTGGTKPMSAAVVWASSRWPCDFNYVSGERKKEGLGVVIDGRERSLLLQNPWDQIAYYEVETAIELFNRGQYGNAAELLRDVHRRVADAEVGRLLEVLGEVFEGYYRWDIFDHIKAVKLLKQTETALHDLALRHQAVVPQLKEFSKLNREALFFLREIVSKPKQLTRPFIWDLLANARRRADLEKKYEDAVARVYAVIEKTAQHELQQKFGINTGKAKPEQIPDEMREEYTRKYANDSGILQFGASASYRLLNYLDNPVGRKYFELNHVEDHMAERNHSILAHGFKPMDENKYLDLFDDALHLLGIKADDLPQFPYFTKK